MLKEEITKQMLRQRLVSLLTDLYLRGGQMTVSSFESLCRRIHCVEHKLATLKGGFYDKLKEDE